MGIIKGIKRSFKERNRRNDFERRVQSEADKIYEKEYRKGRIISAKRNAIQLARQDVKGRKTKGSGANELFKGLGQLSQRSGGYWESQMKGRKGKNSLF